MAIINQSQTGVDTSDATATAADIALGKVAYGANGREVGEYVQPYEMYYGYFSIPFLSKSFTIPLLFDDLDGTEKYTFLQIFFENSSGPTRVFMKKNGESTVFTLSKQGQNILVNLGNYATTSSGEYIILREH